MVLKLSTPSRKTATANEGSSKKNPSSNIRLISRPTIGSSRFTISETSNNVTGSP